MIAKRLLGIQKAISPPAPASTDVYYDFRSLILNMQGSAGSTTFTDSSPNNLAITAYGNAQLASDATFGTVASFDGSGDRLNLASNSAFGFGTGDFTVETWIYLNSINNNYTQVLPNVPVSGGFSVYYTGPGNYFNVGANSIIISNRISNYGAIPFTWNTNTWYHMAVSRSNGSLRVFMNGTQVGSTITNTPNYATGGMNIGGNTDNAAHTVNGLIGPLRVSPWAVYKSNFTPSQDLFPAVQDSTYADPYYDKVALQLKFDGTNGSTSFVDSGPNALAVTAVGNAQVSTTQAKYGGASAYFDGAGDAVQIPFNAALDLTSGDFTIEGWVYFNAVSGTPTIITPFGTGTTFGGWVIALNSSSRLTFYLSTAANTWNLATNVLFSATAVVTGTWYHFALVRNGSAFKPYLNGIAGTTFTSSSTLYNNSRPLKIGAEKDSNVLPLNGYIDDLRITKYARYQSSFTPPTQAHPNIYNPYTTLPVSGAALWLDGADSSTLFTDAGVTPVNKSGDLVYQWSDKSGNNRHATQATSGNRPTWVPPASGQNGFGVVGFNGATTFLSIADTAGLQFGTGDFTLFFAGVNSNVSRGSAYANTFISKGYTNIEFYQYQGLIQGYIGGTSNSPKTGSGTVSNNSSYVAHMIRSSGSTYVAANNVSGTPVTNTANANGSGTNINIGSRSPFNTTLTYLGSMYEILAFNRALSPTEITSVQSYLKAKWGTP